MTIAGVSSSAVISQAQTTGSGPATTASVGGEGTTGGNETLERTRETVYYELVDNLDRSGLSQRRNINILDRDEDDDTRATGPSETARASEQLREAQIREQVDRQVRDLQNVDRRVRAHEQAHAAAGGQYAGAPSYQYQRGPDGRNYAVAGEVQISTSPIKGDPKATIEKMETVRRAALAPVDPSPQDKIVAQKATRRAARARIELNELQQEKMRAEQEVKKARLQEQAKRSEEVAERTRVVEPGERRFLEQGPQSLLERLNQKSRAGASDNDINSSRVESEPRVEASNSSSSAE